MKSIFKAVFIITLFSVLTRALGFFFRVYLSRSIGAEGLGLYQIAFSVFAVLESFIASGIPLTVSKGCSRFEVKKDRKSQSSLTIAAFVIGITTALILCLVVLIFRNLFGKLFTDVRCLSILISLLPALVFTSIYSIFRGYLWGHNKFFLVGFTEFIEQILRIVVCVILLNTVFTPIEGALGASVSFTIACAISSILVLVLYFVKGGKLASPKKQFLPVLKSATPITGFVLPPIF